MSAFRQTSSFVGQASPDSSGVLDNTLVYRCRSWYRDSKFEARASIRASSPLTELPDYRAVRSPDLTEERILRFTLSTAYISIGSNLGNRLGYIREAIKKIDQSKVGRICKTSSVYETQPVEYRVKGQGSRVKSQSWFLNMVLELETTSGSLNLLELILDIENQMGRKRNQRYGPRNIDLDLLLYDDLVLSSDKLTLPHPRMHERRFVLVPLAEISPQVVHPLLKKNVKRLLEDLSTDSISEKDEFEVRLYSEKVF
ncbi:MAG: 2-amino-4-hydroxy-6-hydroxymethyldihydropteridine diphosphokinase [candidate division Zixibacteria bacterium]|nr:2-amino-4-hydroxy-6-hydroxymethyldihydropteridine diphosphokinase [candidate division Zixibacteria bacterium]